MSDERYLLKAAEIAALPRTEKTHFLNENARRKNLSLGDLTGLTGLGVHLIEVAPGAETTEFHVHYMEDECVFVLEGTGTAVLGDDSAEIGPGDFIGYRRGGKAHTIENTGTETLRCLVIGQRLDHDMADYPRLSKRIFRNTGMPWQLADHADLKAPPAGTGKK